MGQTGDETAAPLRRRGRPPKSADRLLLARHIRLSQQMVADIERLAEDDGAHGDFSSMVRALLAEAIAARKRLRSARNE